MKRNAVAGGDRRTVEAVREVITAGGNAIDGAVAGVFVSMVSEAALTSAAGGGCLQVMRPGEEPLALDFFVDMPMQVRTGPELDFVPVDVDFGSALQTFHIGRASCAVPGTLAGLHEAHARFGRLPLQDVIGPAVRCARHGIALSPMQASFFRILSPILQHSPSARALFAPRGRLPVGGETFRMPAFADFLEEAARQGPDLLYSGEAAASLLRWSREGGLLQASDLRRYRVRERKPLKVEVDGFEIFLNPPPAQGGLHLQDALRRLSSRDVSVAGMARALLETGPKADPAGGGSTTHLSVLDAEGNAVAVTTTNGEGCGHVLPEFGFMPNNMLGEADLNPLGFHRAPPGKRLATMVAPTLVARKGQPYLITGSAGSNRIRSALFQILVRVLLLGEELQQATAAPRFHIDGQTLQLEPGFTPRERAELGELLKINVWQETSLYFGGANSVMPDAACGDPRRSGWGLIFNSD